MERTTDKKKTKKFEIMLACICIIPLVIGIILLGEGKKTTVYSTTDYWVAQDSHHVYEKGTGHIIDIIEEDESIKIEGNKITVTKLTAAYRWGCALTVLFGMCTVGLIIGYVGTSDWWDKVAHGIDKDGNDKDSEMKEFEIRCSRGVDGNKYTTLIKYNGSGGNVTIPNGVHHIGRCSFAKCTELTSVCVPEGVSQIGELAFIECKSLTKVLLPKSLRIIDNHAFDCCENLAEISIPNGVTWIGGAAFHGCSNLMSITLPVSLNKIFDSFSLCTELSSITVSDGNRIFHSSGNCLIETTKKALILGCKNSIIPADGSVTRIGSGAFGYCDGLEHIDIPEGVTNIDIAFYNCINLCSVSLPHSLQTIGMFAFKNCVKLKSIVIPENVTEVSSGAFGGCLSLKKVIAPIGLDLSRSEIPHSCTIVRNK